MSRIDIRRSNTGRRIVATLAAIVMTAAMAAGCGAPEVKPGSLAKNVSLEGASYTVGSKKFAGQRILCHLAIAALRSAGAQVTSECGLGGTNDVRTALLSGEIDMYWAYTGTTWVQFLDHEPIPDREKLYRQVKEHGDKNGIVWLRPTRANNTYAFAVDRNRAEQLGLDTLADMAAYVPNHPRPELVCVENEYLHRSDGLRGLLETYDFTIPAGSLRVFTSSAKVYGATSVDPESEKTAAESDCLFGEVYALNGRIKAKGLKVLKDTKNYHTIYNAAVAMRKQAHEQEPEVDKALEPIAKALTQDVMSKLDTRVVKDDKSPKAVATTWLRQQGFIGGG